MLPRPSTSSTATLVILLYIFMLAATDPETLDPCTRLKTHGPDLVARIKTPDGQYYLLLIAGNQMSAQTYPENTAAQMSVTNKHWIPRPHPNLQVGNGSFGMAYETALQVALFYHDIKDHGLYHRMMLEFSSDMSGSTVTDLKEYYFDYDLPGTILSFGDVDGAFFTISDGKKNYTLTEPSVPIPTLSLTKDKGQLSEVWVALKTKSDDTSQRITIEQAFIQDKDDFPSLTSDELEKLNHSIKTGHVSKSKDYVIFFDNITKTVFNYRWYRKNDEERGNRDETKLYHHWNATFEEYFQCAQDRIPYERIGMVIGGVALAALICMALDYCYVMKKKEEEKERKRRRRRKKRKSPSDSDSPISNLLESDMSNLSSALTDSMARSSTVSSDVSSQVSTQKSSPNQRKSPKPSKSPRTSARKQTAIPSKGRSPVAEGKMSKASPPSAKRPNRSPKAKQDKPKGPKPPPE